MGRYLVNRLGRIGSQVVLAYRGEERSYARTWFAFRSSSDRSLMALVCCTDLKVMGDLGQLVPARIDIRDQASLERYAFALLRLLLLLLSPDTQSQQSRVSLERGHQPYWSPAQHAKLYP